MHPHLKRLLKAAGCSADTDAEMKAYHEGMSAKDKADLDAKLKTMMDADPDGADLSTPIPAGEPVDMSGAELSKKLTEMQAALTAMQAAMTPKTPAQQAAALAAQRQNPADNPRSPGEDADVMVALEKKRTGGIRALAAGITEGSSIKIPEALINKAIGDNLSVANARPIFLKHISEQATPAMTVGDDKKFASLRDAIPHALAMRANNIAPDRYKATMARSPSGGCAPTPMHDRAPELAQLTYKQMLGMYYESLGFPEVYRLNDRELEQIIGPRGMRRVLGGRTAALAESTSDFGSITIDAQNRSLRFFYLDADKTWPIWAEMKTAPDFKNINRIVLSEAGNMVARNEGGEAQYNVLRDSKEVYTLQELAQIVRITRRTFLDDSLDALASIPRLFSLSASRAEDNVAYAVLTANPNMADGGALFNNTAYSIGGSGHQNYSSSGAAPSIAQLQIGAASMEVQMGLNNAAYLELEPGFILVPSSIKYSTQQMLWSERIVASQSSSGSVPTTLGESNPFYSPKDQQGGIKVVSSVRLNQSSTTAWYLIADYRKGRVNTVEVCFLRDEPEPVIRQETDFDTEDVKLMCRHTIAAKAIDFRGLYKNAGQ